MGNLTLKQKFTAFAVMATLVITALAAGSYTISSMQRKANAQYAESMETLQNQMRADMAHDAIRSDVLAYIVEARRKNAEGTAQAADDLKRHIAGLRETMSAASRSLTDKDARAAMTRAEEALERYAQAAQGMVQLAAQDVPAAEARMPEFLKSFKALEDEMGALGKVIDDGAEAARLRNEATMHDGNLILIAIGLVAVALLLALSVIIARSVMRPLGGDPADVVRIANRVAAGDLSRAIDVRSGDTTSVIAAMAGMQSMLKAFLTAQEAMADEHDKGAISYRVDAAQFPGSYGELAKKTNDLVASHIAVKMRVVEVVSEYAKGNLSVDMDRLPGEKAKITDAIDGVKASLMSVNGEIAKLVAAAADGDFSVRGDASSFDHQFRRMVEDLNRLMNAADTGITAVATVLQRVSEGDLTQRVDGDLKGKFAMLKDDTNKTVEQLARVIGQIRGASNTIDLASREIAQGNADLSQRTEEQASSLEETASSMEEFTSTVRQNADNARQANQLAAGASEVAVKGGTVMREVVETMDGITTASKKIADIIGVIDGIAFQTNILALNAAVEAARAGEQGRGFAVVATEVRNLAQRSANAAKEIKGLIEDSVKRVDSGSKLVAQAGVTMDDVVNSVRRVSDMISEITAASDEQSAGIEQVNSAVTQMDEVTQQNAALVEEAAAAAESLQEQAGALVQAVSVFKVSANDAVAVSAPAWDGASERRGPDRAKNVARMPGKGPLKKAPTVKAEPKKVANSEDWQEF